MTGLQTFLIYAIVAIPLSILLVILLTRPKNFILGFILLAPAINALWSFRVYNFSLIEIFYGIFPLLFIFIYFKMKDKDWKWGRFNTYFLLLLLSYLIPTLRLALSRRPEVFNSLELFIKVFFGYAIYSLAVNLFTSEDREKIIEFILLAVLTINLMVAFQLISGNTADSIPGWHMSGIYHDPGQYTRMALLGIIILLPALGFLEKRPKTFSRFAMLALCIVTLGFSISRNVVLSVIVVFAVCAFFLRKYVLILTLSLVIVGFYLAAPTVKENYELKLEKEINFLRGDPNIPLESLGSGRIGLWKRSIERYKKGSFVERMFGSGVDIGPHGQFISLLLSSGIFGLIVSFVFYAVLFKFLWDRFRLQKDNLLAFYGILIVVATFVLSIGSTPMFNFYFQGILFVFVALLEIEEREKEELEG